MASEFDVSRVPHLNPAALATYAGQVSDDDIDAMLRQLRGSWLDNRPDIDSGVWLTLLAALRHEPTIHRIAERLLATQQPLPPVEEKTDQSPGNVAEFLVTPALELTDGARLAMAWYEQTPGEILDLRWVHNFPIRNAKAKAIVRQLVNDPEVQAAAKRVGEVRTPKPVQQRATERARVLEAELGSTEGAVKVAFGMIVLASRANMCAVLAVAALALRSGHPLPLNHSVQIGSNLGSDFDVDDHGLVTEILGRLKNIGGVGGRRRNQHGGYQLTQDNAVAGNVALIHPSGWRTQLGPFTSKSAIATQVARIIDEAHEEGSADNADLDIIELIERAPAPLTLSWIKRALETVAPYTTDPARAHALIADLEHPDPDVAIGINFERIRHLVRQVATELNRRELDDPARYSAVAQRYDELRTSTDIAVRRPEYVLRQFFGIAEAAGARSDLTASTAIAYLYALHRQLADQSQPIPGEDYDVSVSINGSFALDADGLVQRSGPLPFEDRELASEILHRVASADVSIRTGPRPGWCHIEVSPDDPTGSIRVKLPAAHSDLSAIGRSIADVAGDIALLIDGAHPDTVDISDRTADRSAALASDAGPAAPSLQSIADIRSSLGLQPHDDGYRAALQRLIEPVFGQIEGLLEGFNDDAGKLERIKAAHTGLRTELYPLDDQPLKHPERAISYATELLGYASELRVKDLPEDDPERVALERLDEPLGQLGALTGTEADVDTAVAIAEALSAEAEWENPEWLGSEGAFREYLELLERRDPSRLLELQVSLSNSVDSGIDKVGDLYVEAKRQWMEFSVRANASSEEALAAGLDWLKQPHPTAQKGIQLLTPTTAGAVSGGLAGSVFGLAAVGSLVGVIAAFLLAVLAIEIGPQDPELDTKDHAT